MPKRFKPKDQVPFYFKYNGSNWLRYELECGNAYAVVNPADNSYGTPQKGFVAECVYQKDVFNEIWSD